MLTATSPQLTLWDIYSQIFGILTSVFAIAFFVLNTTPPRSISEFYEIAPTKRGLINLAALAIAAFAIWANFHFGVVSG